MKMTTALVRAIDVPYQAGRMTADIEHQMIERSIRSQDLDIELHRRLGDIYLKTLSYTRLQQAEYERARIERKRELSPALEKLERNSRPYWETHGTLVEVVGPNVTRIVLLMEVPEEMLKRYPQYSPVPRQEELFI